MYPQDDSDDDATLASELLVAGVPRSRVKCILKGRINDVYVDELADSVMARKLETGGIKGAELPEIKQLVREAEAPNDYLDRLFMHLMKDPVVLSSGEILDRNSVVDENDNLRFKHCPFTRVLLKKDVYPLKEKKKQIEKFTHKRDAAIRKIAQKLIENGRFRTFGEVLEAVEDYLKDLGDSNYLPLARELANIWSGIDGSSSIPLFLFVEEIKGQVRQNRWHCALKSGYLQFDVGKILVAAENIGHQGHNSKNRFALVLYNEHDILVERCEIFQHHERSRVSKTFHLFDANDSIVTKATRGFTYKMEYIVGDGDDSSIDVKGFICKIFPDPYKSACYRMRDQRGEMGLFMGSVDRKGKAKGSGSMEYDDGRRFVGEFQNGMMLSGVLYRGPCPVFTMKNTRWSTPPDLNTQILRKYPQEVMIVTGKDRYEVPKHSYPPPDSRETRVTRRNHEKRETREPSPNLDDLAPIPQLPDDYSFPHQPLRYSKGRSHGERSTAPSLQHKDRGRCLVGTSRHDADVLGESYVAETLERTNGGRNLIANTLSLGGAHGQDARALKTSRQGARSLGGASHDNGGTRNIHSRAPIGRSVPGYGNHDEYSEVTKEWNEQEMSLGSVSPGGIELDGITEVVTKSTADLGEANIPIFFSVKKVVGGETNNEWICAIQSGPLLDNVGKVMVAVDLQDDHECSLALSLYDKDNGLVQRCNITEKLSRADDKSSYFRNLTVEDAIVSKAREGFVYKLEYALSGGSPKTVHAEDLICKIFPACMDLPTYQMKDQDGELGTYMGPVDRNQKAYGAGVMEYNDGKRFVGHFKKGVMDEGVLYYGADYLCCMLKGKWDTENQHQHIVKRHPQRVHVLNNRVGIC